jgi:hypothetical protein
MFDKELKQSNTAVDIQLLAFFSYLVLAQVLVQAPQQVLLVHAPWLLLLLLLGLARALQAASDTALFSQQLCSLAMQYMTIQKALQAYN